MQAPIRLNPPLPAVHPTRIRNLGERIRAKAAARERSLKLAQTTTAVTEQWEMETFQPQAGAGLAEMLGLEGWTFPDGGQRFLEALAENLDMDPPGPGMTDNEAYGFVQQLDNVPAPAVAQALIASGAVPPQGPRMRRRQVQGQQSS